MNEIIIVDAIKELTNAVKTQDNHVLSDLDTYPVVTALEEIKNELHKINLNLIGLRNDIKDTESELDFIGSQLLDISNKR